MFIIGSMARRPLAWLLAALVGVLIAGWSARGVQLRADLLSMLPEEVEAAQAYRTFLEDFGGLEQIFVLVSEDPPVEDQGTESAGSLYPEELERRLVQAALLLEERLESLDGVASVRAGIEPEDEQFLFESVVPSALVRDETWTTARVAERLSAEALRARAEDLRRKVRNPVGEIEIRLARWDPLGFATESLLGGATGLDLRVDPITGLFRGRDGAALLTLTPTVSELDAQAGRALASELWSTFDAVLAEVGEGVRIGAVGGPLYAAEDEKVIRTDLQRTITTSVVGCLIVLTLSFGGWRAAAIATAVLGAAFALNFGWLRFVHGELLAVSLGFSAVLVGLGIDYVIHAVTRYRECLEDGDASSALEALMRHSARPLVASALTTSAAFAVLLMSDLRILQEIGWLVASGIVAMLVATFFVGCPLMVLCFRSSEAGHRTDRSSDGERADNETGLGGRLALLWVPAGRWPAALVKVSRSRRAAVIVGFLLVFAVSGLLATRLRFEPRFEDLRPEEFGLEQTERLLNEQFALATDTVTVLVHGRDRDQALERSAAVAETLRHRTELGGHEMQIQSPVDFIGSPARESARIAALSSLPWQEALERFETELRRVGLSPHGFALGLDALRRLGEQVPPVDASAADAPDWIRSLVAEDPDGSTTIALRVRTDDEGTVLLSEDALARSLRASAGVDETRAEEDSPSVQIASVYALGEQMRVMGERETTFLAAASLAVVVLVVAVSVGFSMLATFLALLPILVGAAASFGLLGATSGRLDFLSLAVIPMLFGIGIDDGLHALCGGRPGSSRRVRPSLRATPQRVLHAGRAITLTTITTVVGFGSLATSAMSGLRTGGVVVAVGVVVCWLATVMLLPALTSTRGAAAPPGEDDAEGDGRPTRADDTVRNAVSAHAPRVANRRGLAGRLHFSGAFWYRLHAWCMRVLPSWFISALIWPVVSIFFVLLRGVRRALVGNLRAASGAQGWLGDRLRGLRALVNFAWCFSETYEGYFSDTARKLSSVTGEDNWREVTAPDEAGEPVGFLLVTGHIGHWEVGSHLSQFEQPRKIHVVREPEMSEEAQAFLEELFERQAESNYQVHFARAEDPMLGGRLVSALRRGEVVALQGDRPRAGGRVLEVELFGRPFELPLGPFAMARAARVPLLPVFVFRAGRNRSELHLRAPIRVARTRDRQADLLAAAGVFAREIEWAVGRRPEQWFCLRELWPSGGEESGAR